MRLSEWDGRSPDAPEGWSGVVPVGPHDVDGDGDGVPDTVVATRARGGAWVFTDLDGDGFADVVLDLDPTADDPAGPGEEDGQGVLPALLRLVTG